MKKVIVFADFDDTITMADTLVGTASLFTPPDEFKLYGRQLMTGDRTLSQVIHRIFDGAPSSLMPRLLEYVETVPLRPGFPEFLDEMDRRGIPVVVISGGVRQFSQLRLSPYLHRLAGLHAADLDTSAPRMKLRSPYDNGDELLAKTEVMKLYDYDCAIGIGDGLTDRNMAAAADTIFARGGLARQLTKQGRPFLPYEDFYDVIRSFPAVN